MICRACREGDHPWCRGLDSPGPGPQRPDETPEQHQARVAEALRIASTWCACAHKPRVIEKITVPGLFAPAVLVVDTARLFQKGIA